jgi:hypothetical protein
MVAAVRAAAARHAIVWRDLVPTRYEVNAAAEAAEDIAFQDMADAKQALREHICRSYGVTAAELCSLASV